MVNKDINIGEKAYEYQKYGKTRIDNFLDTEYADALHRFFTKEMPRDWWSLSTMPKRPGVEGELDVERLFDDADFIQANQYKYEIADEHFNLDEFSYSFKRTLDDHVEECACQECDLRKVITSQKTINIINTITQTGVTKADTLFSSLYEKGDFLNIHHDGPNGKVGFVYNLCKEWRADWGGLLQILSHDWKTVQNTFIPGYNTLTLFDSSNDTGFPHNVTHVVRDNVMRISFTGWFTL